MWGHNNINHVSCATDTEFFFCAARVVLYFFFWIAMVTAFVSECLVSCLLTHTSE